MRMNKHYAFLLILFLIFIVGCKQKVSESANKPIEAIKTAELPTGDSAVDSVGQAIGGIDDIEKEMNELNDLDSGLSDVENI